MPLMTVLLIVIEASIRLSKKRYFDYLPLLNIESLFVTPTDITAKLNQYTKKVLK